MKWFVEVKGFEPHYCPKGCQSAMAQAGYEGGRLDVLKYLIDERGGAVTLADNTWLCLRQCFIGLARIKGIYLL